MVRFFWPTLYIIIRDEQFIPMQKISLIDQMTDWQDLTYAIA